MPEPTLADFLRARIAEDERAASGDHPSPMSVGHYMIGQDRRERIQALALGARCPTCHAGVGATCLAMTPPHHSPKPVDSLHAARMDIARVEHRRQYGSDVEWNSARVLAECAAKRAIVANLTSLASRQPIDDWSPADSALVDTLRSLAAVYSDHPDYRSEWAP